MKQFSKTGERYERCNHEHQDRLSQHKAVLEKQQQEHEGEVTQLASQVETLKTEIQRQRTLNDTALLRASAHSRLAWCAALLVIIAVVTIGLVLRFETGSDYEKLKSGLPVFGIALTVWLGTSWVLIGSKERLEALGWPLRKLLGSDSSAD